MFPCKRVFSSSTQFRTTSMRAGGPALDASSKTLEIFGAERPAMLGPTRLSPILGELGLANELFELRMPTDGLHQRSPSKVQPRGILAQCLAQRVDAQVRVAEVRCKQREVRHVHVQQLWRHRVLVSRVQRCNPRVFVVESLR